MKCKGKTKAGKRCKANALKGTDRCSAHPVDPGSARFGSPAQAREAGAKGGRPRLPRPTELARQLVEENVLAVLAPHFRVLGFEVVRDAAGVRLEPREGGGAKLFGTSAKTGRVNVSEHDDLGAHIAAAEKLLDRIYGKPKQATEISGPEGGPVEIVPVKRQGAAVVDLLKGTGAVREDG